MESLVLKYLGAKPTSKGQPPQRKYRGDGIYVDLESKDKTMHEAVVSVGKAGQLLSSFPDQWEIKSKLTKEEQAEVEKSVMNWENRMISKVNSTKGVDVNPIVIKPRKHKVDPGSTTPTP